MVASISPSILAKLRGVGTSAVCNAIETFKVRLRNEGYLDPSIQCRSALDHPMVGYAVTVEMRTDLPPSTGTSYIDRNDWWEKLLAVPAPKIVVIADAGKARSVGAVAGEVHAAIYKALGAIGIVTDGAVRDLRELDGLGMHIHAAGVSPSHAYAHVISVGNPIQIGGLRVETGDLLHGDRNGVVKIPPFIVDELSVAIARMRKHEDMILALCRAADFSVPALRKLLGAMSDTAKD